MSGRRNALLFGWTLALAAIALFAWLGHWQLGRMHEKQAMLDAVQQALLGNALPLGSAAERFSGQFAWVEGGGRFVPLRVLLDNQIRVGQPGVRLYCVFEPDDSPSSRSMLVDLGWLPLDGRRELPNKPCPAGHHQVRGLLAKPASAGLRMGQALQRKAPDLWLATRIEPSQLAKEWRLVDGLYPAVLRLDPALPIGYARDLDVLPNTLPPEQHLGYAVQWFALALAVLATALVLTFRKKKPRP